MTNNGKIPELNKPTQSTDDYQRSPIGVGSALPADRFPSDDLGSQATAAYTAFTSRSSPSIPSKGLEKSPNGRLGAIALAVIGTAAIVYAGTFGSYHLGTTDAPQNPLERICQVNPDVTVFGYDLCKK